MNILNRLESVKSKESNTQCTWKIQAMPLHCFSAMNLKINSTIISYIVVKNIGIPVERNRNGCARVHPQSKQRNNILWSSFGTSQRRCSGKMASFESPAIFPFFFVLFFNNNIVSFAIIIMIVTTHVMALIVILLLLMMLVVLVLVLWYTRRYPHVLANSHVRVETRNVRPFRMKNRTSCQANQLHLTAFWESLETTRNLKICSPSS